MSNFIHNCIHQNKQMCYVLCGSKVIYRQSSVKTLYKPYIFGCRGVVQLGGLVLVSPELVPLKTLVKDQKRFT